MGDSHLILLPVPGVGLLALTADELQRALNQGAEVLPQSTNTVPAGGAPNRSDGLLDADGMAAATGVPASWFATAARANKISYVGFGRWIRFDLAVVARELAQARKATVPESPPKIPQSRRHKLNGMAAHA
jgi:hypothetical protein